MTEQGSAPRFRVGGDVGGTHTDLVLNDLDTGAGSKAKKAAELGIRTVDEDGWIEMVSG